jgi:hypothetical protein
VVGSARRQTHSGEVEESSLLDAALGEDCCSIAELRRAMTVAIPFVVEVTLAGLQRYHSG